MEVPAGGITSICKGDGAVSGNMSEGGRFDGSSRRIREAIDELMESAAGLAAPTTGIDFAPSTRDVTPAAESGIGLGTAARRWQRGDVGEVLPIAWERELDEAPCNRAAPINGGGRSGWDCMPVPAGRIMSIGAGDGAMSGTASGRRFGVIGLVIRDTIAGERCGTDVTALLLLPRVAGGNEATKFVGGADRGGGALNGGGTLGALMLRSRDIRGGEYGVGVEGERSLLLRPRVA